MYFESKYLNISWCEEFLYLFIDWQPESSQMKEVNFKDQIKGERAAVDKFSPKYIIANTIDFGFPITPDLQEWHNNFLFPIFKKVGIKKLAIIVSKDLFAQISIEQMMEENKEINMVTRYFTSFEEAKDWMKE